MKIFFAVYLTLIAGVLSLAFLLPSGKKEAAANVRQRIPVASIPTSLSSPTTSVTKKVGITKVVPTPSLSFSEEVEQEIHILVNAARAQNGLVPLVWDSALTVLAREHSVDMQTHTYFAHDNLLGCSSSCRVTSAGYAWVSLGENIYTMSGFTVSSKEAAEMVVIGWLKSPGHRANILSTTYTNQGVGVATEGKTLYATEDFAKPR